MSEAFDFSRYAPLPRPRLAWDNIELQEQADLATAIAALRNSLRIVPLATRVILAIAVNRARVRFDQLMQSLTVSWACAGAGWGLALGLAATLYWVR